MGQYALDLTCQGVYLRYAVNFVAEKFNSDCVFARLRREYFKHVSADSELVSNEIYIIALILYFNELVYNFIAALFHSGAERNNHAAVVNRVAQAVYTRHTGDNYNIAPFGERRGCGMAELVYFIIYSGILFDISVR